MKKRILFIVSILYAINTISTNAQTITAPTGQNLTIANSVNVTGGSVNIKADSAYKIGGKIILTTKGNNNLLVGEGAGVLNTGANNTFMGFSAGNHNIAGTNNLFFGAYSGYANTSGTANAFVGTSSGLENTSGSNNMFLGVAAGAANQVGSSNTFIGVNSGRYSVADGNSFIGVSSGYATTTGYHNTALGALSGQSNVGGAQNTFVGFGSGANLTSGNLNTFIGYNAATSSATLTNATAIGANASVTASNSVVLGNNANVGIGTSAPANKLEVVSGTAGQSGLRLTGLAGRAGNLQVNAAGDVILVASGAARVAAAADDANWTLTSNYLYNNSNGVVIGEGITSTPAGYKLFVSDGILTEKVKVAVKNEEDWADRVFEDNYKMMSLAQTNQYIKENKHLPGVPSTQEMIEKGNDLHKTDVILLTKIEELYRHVIKIEQENQALKKELKSLKNRKR